MSIRFLGRCLFGSKVRAYSCCSCLITGTWNFVVGVGPLFVVSTGEVGSDVAVLGRKEGMLCKIERFIYIVN